MDNESPETRYSSRLSRLRKIRLKDGLRKKLLSSFMKRVISYYRHVRNLHHSLKFYMYLECYDQYRSEIWILDPLSYSLYC